MSYELDDKALARLTEQYVAVWNEPDGQTRRKRIAELWTADGAQILTDPPQDVRDAATRLAFPVPYLEVHGHDALEGRVIRAYEMFVAAGEYTFAPRGRAVRLAAGLAGLSWAMVSTADGTEAGGGYDILALDQHGRIRSDHQYIGPA